VLQLQLQYSEGI